VQTLIADLYSQFQEDLSHTSNVTEIENLKIKYLGKKGSIQDLMKGLKEASPEERPLLGKGINDLKEIVEAKIEERQATFGSQEQQERLEKETLDITLPGKRKFSGRKHIITHTMEEMLGILGKMGFSVQIGPEIESDFYNFEALNLGPDHPARDMQDTFYITPKMLLRTHTSNTQVRVMENHRPPIRVVAPGKAYRNEDISARSHVFFHQLEAFYIDQNVSFGDLLGTMEEFLKKLFHADVEMRVRPSYFPFVEPGMEVDIRCLSCKGSGCNLCKYTGWLEIAGAGMMHPDVLRTGGIDPEEYTGFAWGMGIERVVMLKYGIKDIRQFTENDLRFLQQFT
jgi:phenylalanyl-tRNA synthetase alpha chain